MPRPGPAEPDITPHQRWVAAQRLAAGDSPRVAASWANVKLEWLQILVAGDPEFDALVADCRELNARTDADRRERMRGIVWDSAERALAAGKVSTLNLCLRALGLLAAQVGDRQAAALDAFFDGLTDEQLTEYDALGEDRGEEDEPGPEAPANDDEPAAPTGAAHAPPADGRPEQRRPRLIEPPLATAPVALDAYARPALPADPAACLPAADRRSSPGSTAAAAPSPPAPPRHPPRPAREPVPEWHRATPQHHRLRPPPRGP